MKRGEKSRVLAAGGIFLLTWLAAYASSVRWTGDLLWEFALPAAGASAGLLCGGPGAWERWLKAWALGSALVLAAVWAGVPRLVIRGIDPDYGDLSAGCGFSLLLVTAWHWLAAGLGGGAAAALPGLLRVRRRRERSAPPRTAP